MAICGEIEQDSCLILGILSYGPGKTDVKKPPTGTDRWQRAHYSPVGISRAIRDELTREKNCKQKNPFEIEVFSHKILSKVRDTGNSLQFALKYKSERG